MINVELVCAHSVLVMRESTDTRRRIRICVYVYVSVSVCQRMRERKRERERERERDAIKRMAERALDGRAPCAAVYDIEAAHLCMRNPRAISSTYTPKITSQHVKRISPPSSTPATHLHQPSLTSSHIRTALSPSSSSSSIHPHNHHNTCICTSIAIYRFLLAGI